MWNDFIYLYLSRSYMFRAQTQEIKERGGNQSTGIDFFITQERVIFLDTQVRCIVGILLTDTFLFCVVLSPDCSSILWCSDRRDGELLYTVQYQIIKVSLVFSAYTQSVYSGSPDQQRSQTASRVQPSSHIRGDAGTCGLWSAAFNQLCVAFLDLFFFFIKSCDSIVQWQLCSFNIIQSHVSFFKFIYLFIF